MMNFLKKSVSLAALLVLAFVVTASAQNTGGIKGKVRDLGRGDGIADAAVTVRQKGQDIKTVKTDEKGDFLIEGLESGLYNLVFEKSGFSQGTMYNVEVKKKKITDLGSRLTLRTDQGTLVLIKGSVFNQEGVSVQGAKVQIERILENGSTKKVGDYFTTLEGEFTFRFAEGAAKFRVTATAKGVSASKEISVDNAAVYRLALTLNLPKDN